MIQKDKLEIIKNGQKMETKNQVTNMKQGRKTPKNMVIVQKTIGIKVKEIIFLKQDMYQNIIRLKSIIAITQ